MSIMVQVVLTVRVQVLSRGIGCDSCATFFVLRRPSNFPFAPPNVEKFLFAPQLSPHHTLAGDHSLKGSPSGHENRMSVSAASFVSIVARKGVFCEAEVIWE